MDEKNVPKNTGYKQMFLTQEAYNKLVNNKLKALQAETELQKVVKLKAEATLGVAGVLPWWESIPNIFISNLCNNIGITVEQFKNWKLPFSVRHYIVQEAKVLSGGQFAVLLAPGLKKMWDEEKAAQKKAKMFEAPVAPLQEFKDVKHNVLLAVLTSIALNKGKIEMNDKEELVIPGRLVEDINKQFQWVMRSDRDPETNEVVYILCLE